MLLVRYLHLLDKEEEWFTLNVLPYWVDGRTKDCPG